MGLTDRDARQYAFRFLSSPIDVFVDKINQYNVLLAIHSQHPTSSTQPRDMMGTFPDSFTNPVVLMSDGTPTSIRYSPQ